MGGGGGGSHKRFSCFLEGGSYVSFAVARGGVMYILRGRCEMPPPPKKPINNDLKAFTCPFDTGIRSICRPILYCNNYCMEVIELIKIYYLIA